MEMSFIDVALGFLLACWLPGFLLVAVVIGVTHAVRVGVAHRGLNQGDAVCGHCSYPTRGIASWQCPECGNDLRIVGVRTIAVPVVWSGAARQLLWLAAVPLPAVLLSLIVVALMPWCHDAVWRAELAGDDGTVEIYGEGVGYGPFRRIDRMTVQLYHVDESGNWSGRALVIDLVVADGRPYITRPAPPGGDSPPDLTAAFAEALRGADSPPDEDKLAAQSADLAAAARAVAAGRSMRSVKLSSYRTTWSHVTSEVRSDGALLLALALGGAIWLSLVNRLIKGHARDEAQAKEARDRVMRELGDQIGKVQARRG